MECLENRIESFHKPVRVQNAAKTGAAKNIKWPHPSSFIAKPDTLAEAGFYFDPSFDERDNVTCFVCGKELAGWEEEDDPFDIHFKKCAKTCAWAVVRCGLRDDLDASGRFVFQDKNRLPTSKAMEKARLQTFTIGDGWVHDTVRNHGASSKKMAKAGFICTPQEPGDDLATCLYCGLSLSAWDSDDDPIEEHRKRKSECPFFTGSSATTTMSTSTAPKGRSTSKPSSRSSTAPTASSSRASTANTARGRGRSALQDIIEDTIEPLAPPAKSSRKASKSTRKSIAPVEEDEEDETGAEVEEVKKKSRSTSRSVSRKASARSKKVEPVQEEDEAAEEEEDIPITTATTKSTTSKKGSRSRKTAVTNPETVEEKDERATLNKSTISKKPSRSKKSVAPSPSIEDYATAPEEVEDDDEPVVIPNKSTVKKTSRSAKSKKPPPVEDEDDDSERQALTKSTLSKKPSRSKKLAPVENDDEVEKDKPEPSKTTSSRSKKVMPPVEDEDMEEEGEPEPLKKSARSTKAKKALPEVEVDEGSSERPASSRSTISRKSSKSKKSTVPTTATVDDQSSERPASSRSTISKKSSSKSKSKKSTAPPPATVVEDEEVDEVDEPPKKFKLSAKSTTRKTLPSRAPSPSPPPPAETQHDSDGDMEELVVPKKLKKGGKVKKNEVVPVKPVDVVIDEEEDEVEKEFVLAKSTRSVKGSRFVSRTVEVDEEEEEEREVVSKKSKRKEEMTEARTTKSKREEEDDISKVGPKDSSPPTQAKGKAKKVESSSEGEVEEAQEAEQTSVPPKLSIPSWAKPQPIVFDSEQSDSDVEMEDATIVRKMKFKKSSSTERLRLPSPPPPPQPLQLEQDINQGTESEAEVQADLEDIELDAEPETGMDMDIPEPEPLHQQDQDPERRPSGIHQQSLPQVPQEQEHDEDDAISFAPRLVTKPISNASKEQRPRTPNLAPIRNSSAPVILGGPQEENLKTPPKKLLFDSVVLPPPPTSRATGITSFSNSTVQQPQQSTEGTQNSGTEEAPTPQFIPFLSKLPFIPLKELSGAELDMTVEEWIRYQTEVEYDRFKRDGERALERFRKQAEQVRKVIEGL